MHKRIRSFSSALVTGANGFIGQHLIENLEKNGVNVHALVRDKKKLNINRNVFIFEGDISDIGALRKALNDVEIVFHLIAKTHEISKNEDNNDYFKINVEGTRNLLNACIDSKLKHFIYFSSVKTIAEESENILDEDSIPNPTTPYGETKLLAEKLVADYGNKYGFKTTSIRLPLVYGPGNKGNIYKMIEAVDKNRFIMIGRGGNIRSMVYVGNVVDAALSVVNCDGTDGQVYIVTDGIDYPVRELYKAIAERLGKKILPFYVPVSIAKGFALIGDIGERIIRKSLPFNSDILNKLTSSLTFSSRKIQEEIGFKPRYNLYNTINKTIRWHQENS